MIVLLLAELFWPGERGHTFAAAMQNRKFRGRRLGHRDRYHPLNVILQLCLRATYEADSNPRNLVGSVMTLMAFW